MRLRWLIPLSLLSCCGAIPTLSTMALLLSPYILPLTVGGPLTGLLSLKALTVARMALLGSIRNNRDSMTPYALVMGKHIYDKFKGKGKGAAPPPTDNKDLVLEVVVPPDILSQLAKQPGGGGGGGHHNNIPPPPIPLAPGPFPQSHHFNHFPLSSNQNPAHAQYQIQQPEHGAPQARPPNVHGGPPGQGGQPVHFIHHPNPHQHSSTHGPPHAQHFQQNQHSGERLVQSASGHYHVQSIPHNELQSGRFVPNGQHGAHVFHHGHHQMVPIIERHPGAFTNGEQPYAPHGFEPPNMMFQNHHKQPTHDQQEEDEDDLYDEDDDERPMDKEMEKTKEAYLKAYRMERNLTQQAMNQAETKVGQQEAFGARINNKQKEFSKRKPSENPADQYPLLQQQYPHIQYVQPYQHQPIQQVAANQAVYKQAYSYYPQQQYAQYQTQTATVIAQPNTHYYTQQTQQQSQPQSQPASQPASQYHVAGTWCPPNGPNPCYNSQPYYASTYQTPQQYQYNQSYYQQPAPQASTAYPQTTSSNVQPHHQNQNSNYYEIKIVKNQPTPTPKDTGIKNTVAEAVNRYLKDVLTDTDKESCANRLLCEVNALLDKMKKQTNNLNLVIKVRRSVSRAITEGEGLHNMMRRQDDVIHESMSSSNCHQIHPGCYTVSVDKILRHLVNVQFH